MIETTFDKPTVLRRAAEIVKERGWGKGNESMFDGPVCILGACKVALDEAIGIDWRTLDDNGKPYVMEAPYSVLEDLSFTKAINKANGQTPHSRVYSWNDFLPNETGKQTVIDTLLKAAELEEAE